MMLLGHEELERVVSEAETGGPLTPIFSSPEFWSVAIMLSIVGLLYSWEQTIHVTRKILPKTLLPVIDSMLGEMGGLGFIGLFLGIFVTGGPLGNIIAEASEHYLGDEEILLETFEFLHTAFFEVGIGFFAIAGFVVYKVLKQVESITSVSEAIMKVVPPGCTPCLNVLSNALGVENLLVDVNSDGTLTKEEITSERQDAEMKPFPASCFMTTAQVRAEALAIRERFMRLFPSLQSSFRIESYFERIFAERLCEIVELCVATPNSFPCPMIVSLSLSADTNIR